MADTNLSESVSIPALAGSTNHGDSTSPSTAEPVGTMIQRNGVDVTDDFDTIDLPGTITEDPNGTIKYQGSIFQKNGVALNSKELSSIDIITNCDVTESPSGAIEIADTTIKKDSVTIKNSPKNINFLGDMLVTEDPDVADSIVVNLAGEGFFGDGSDGDYTLDGTQDSVAGLFTRGTVNSPITLTKVAPLNVIEDTRTATCQIYMQRYIDYVSAVASDFLVYVEIAMDSPFDAGDVGQTATMQCTYTNQYGVVTTINTTAIISQVISGSRFVWANEGVLAVPIQPYTSEILYSLTVNGKTSVSPGVVERPSYTYVQTEEDVFLLDDSEGGKYFVFMDGAVERTLYIPANGGNRLTTVLRVEGLVGDEVIAPFSSFYITYSNATTNFSVPPTSIIGEAELRSAYIESVMAALGETTNTAGVAIFPLDTSTGLTSDDYVKISGTSDATVDGVYRVIGVGYNVIGLINCQFGSLTDEATGGTCTKLVDYTLERDSFFDNLTINSNVRLCTNNYRLFVRGNLTVNGVLCNNGDVAGTAGYFPTMGVGATGGAGGVTTFPTPQPGFIGGTGGSQTNSIFNSSDQPTKGRGGAGGDGFGSTIVGGVGGSYGDTGSSTKITEPYTLRFNLVTGNCYTFAGSMFRIKTHAGAGGGGGGGVGGFYDVGHVGATGSIGGNGGDNAGYLLICAGIILGTGMILSIGESGKNGTVGDVGVPVSLYVSSGSGGGGGGGGGGAGGIIVLMTRNIVSTVTKECGGGIGGDALGQKFITATGTAVFPNGAYGSIGRTGQIFEFIIT